ncbi:putative bifunctional diguanylate cyclase/phosphodiesterase [Thiomicrorhabdus arctica]|uniref:putative bifunctional diguanylate cyclase/phosphodiesterase n=1 Tax=Thiomicrorhabdus arctica TaxID=131540 RepID=UPI0003815DF0|nr:EAL domain-containing protein [Thiomicrorhabdus arctica]
MEKNIDKKEPIQGKNKDSNEKDSVLLNAQSLRNKAEFILDQKNTNRSKRIDILSNEEILKVIHELQVHQIELEMQNEELQRTQQTLTVEKQRYFDLYNSAPVGYCTLSAENLITKANPMAATLLGINQNELVEQPLSHFIHPEDQDIYYLCRKKLLDTQKQQHFELRLQIKNSAELWVYVVASIEKIAKDSYELRLVLTDISDRKIYENELHRIAKYDALTNLPNRTLLSDRLYQAIAMSLRHNQPLAILCIGLDGFKDINDRYGHEVGDRVLILLAERMKNIMGHEDTLSRFGGDEFVAILLNLSSIEYAIPKINHLTEVINQPININDMTIQVTASIGVSLYPQQEHVDSDILLRQANQAMYHAKLSGKDKYHIFNTHNDDTLRYKYKFIAGMDDALEASEFHLYYQPMVNMKTGKVIGVEALIRWHHPTKGLLTPKEFLPIIVGNKLTVKLGNWVIKTALAQMEHWLAHDVVLNVSVNIDVLQLKENNFVVNLQKMLETHPSINPENLVLEIIETGQIHDLEIVSKVIKQCQILGFSFALDDFGTGYSSLTYLQKLPVSCLKMDRSFIKNLQNNPDNILTLKGIISLASAFRLDIIAEGIDTIEHGEILIEMGCEQAQGNAISYPMPADELPGWLETWKAPSSWKNAMP